MDRPQILEIPEDNDWAYLCYFGVFTYASVLILIVLGILLLSYQYPDQPVFATDQNYQKNSFYVIALFGIFFMSSGIETRILFKKLGQQVREPKLFFHWLWFRSSLREMPYLLGFLAMLAEQNWRRYYILASLASLILVNRYYQKSNRTPYQLVFTAYLKTAVKRRLLWAGGLFISLALFLLLLPNRMGLFDQRINAMKGNMHILQSMVETYAQTWNTYPASLQALEEDAKIRGHEYWIDIINPLTKQEGIGQSFEEVSQQNGMLERLRQTTYQEWFGIRFQLKQMDVKPSACKVFYLRLDPSHYQILGANSMGQLLQSSHDNEILVLSNG